MRAVAEAEARILGASTVVCAAWRILSTPRCERRWRSSAACAAGRRATWEVAPTRWNPRARLEATEMAGGDGPGGAGDDGGFTVQPGRVQTSRGAGSAPRLLTSGNAFGSGGAAVPAEAGEAGEPGMLGSKGGEGAANWGEGAANSPNPGGGRTDGGLGARRANATVGTPIDEAGQPLPRPTVRAVHGDREGKLMSHAFRAFRTAEFIHHTTSPPHDHDLNPIAERIIGLISETAVAIKDSTDAPIRLWPWLIAYAVEWHNSTVSSVGSSSADANISPHQRLTGRPPRVMDLASFGSRAVVLKPPTHQHKPSLSPRGWIGSFLGRSRYSKGGYDVLVGQKIVTSSSVLVDEEHFDWAPPPKRHQPLTAVAHASSPPLRPTAPPLLLPAGAPTSRTLTDPIFGPAPLLPPLVPGGVPLPHNDGGVPSPWNSPSAPQSPHSPSPRASPITFPPLEEDATAPPVPSIDHRRQQRNRACLR